MKNEGKIKLHNSNAITVSKIRGLGLKENRTPNWVYWVVREITST